MRDFDDVEDVIEWLEPLGYLQFWDAIAPYGIDLPDRDHCDEEIMRGVDTTEEMLTFLKGLTRVELTQRYRLKRRSYVETMSMH
ncbi:hypothetical protein LC092_03285 [Stappia stellulata]|uniref:hypothetical protein n=1 Tax=Stappia TaxID=152161 RepID=UPI001CD63868|nr:hypothetical protein [Stappia stellulata]MCA1241456.1 hypothetical protein [Stappia stellulata]